MNYGNNNKNARRSFAPGQKDEGAPGYPHGAAGGNGGKTESGVKKPRAKASAGHAPPRAVQYVGGRPRQRNGESAPTPYKSITQKEERALAAKRKKDEQWEAGIQRVRHGVDRPMLVIILILLCLGTIMVFSASYPSALAEMDDSLYYIRRQLLWLALGGLAMMGVSFVPYPVFKKLTPYAAVLSVAMLVLVLAIGTARGVAQRWIYVGSVSVQPSEIAKIALILTLAKYIDDHFDKTSTRFNKKTSIIQGVLIPGAIMAVFCGLVLLEKHLSGTIILGMIGVCIIFLSGANVGYMLLLYGIPAALCGVIYLATNSYAMERILTHGDQNADVLKEAWQTTQGLYAIGSGGFLGTGLGESNLKYNYVSEAQNDFIFTIWCEEMGFVGALIVIALYGAFVWRGITIAKKAPDTFCSLVAFGITCQVGIQALLNILVVTNLIPNTGVSLPFFSYGGSSLLMLMGEMGILLSISKHSYQKK